MKPLNSLQPHHVALKVHSLEQCEEFYAHVLRLDVIRRNQDEEGRPQSVWFQAGPLILMLEKSILPRITPQDPKELYEKDEQSWHLLAFAIDSDERKAWKRRLAHAEVPILKESDYSLYFADPEGNRVALSHYPTQKQPD